MPCGRVPGKLRADVRRGQVSRTTGETPSLCESVNPVLRHHQQYSIKLGGRHVVNHNVASENRGNEFKLFWCAVTTTQFERMHKVQTLPWYQNSKHCFMQRDMQTPEMLATDRNYRKPLHSDRLILQHKYPR
jgi:hypothetical protein